MTRSRAIGRLLKLPRLLVVTTLAAPRPACAEQEQIIPIAVEYRPAKACPEAEQFTRQLQARQPRVRQVTSAEAKILFRIHFTGTGDGMLGHFEMRGSDGSLTERDIPQADCAEIVTAMALIAAVLVEPSVAASSRVPATPVIAPPQTRQGSLATGRDLHRIGYRAGVGGILEGAVVPALAAGLSIEVGVRWETHRLFSPSLSGALLRAFATHVDSSSRGTARFEWTAFRLIAAPLRWPVEGPVALRPAAFFDVGSFEASGEQTKNAGTTSITWSDLGVLMRLEMTPLERLSLLLDAGIVIPLRHDRFYFAPDDGKGVVFTIPRVDATARFGVATCF